jgi:hypothetical protein
MRQARSKGIKEGCRVIQNFHLVLRGPDGRIKARRVVHNTIPALGDAYVADQMSGKAIAAIGWMAVGTGSPSATALGTELDRNALTSKTQGTAGDDNDVIYVGNWAAADGTGAITEAGLFSANTSGTMLASSSFSVINKGAADTLQITWTITYGST